MSLLPFRSRSVSILLALFLVFGWSTVAAPPAAAADPEVTLTASPNPAATDSLVNLTATVTSGDLPVTIGAVSFKVGAGSHPATFNATTGRWETSISFSDPAVFTVVAQYSDASGTYFPGESAPVQLVFSTPTTTSLSSSLTPSTYGQAVTFTATVAAGATAVGEGTVTFYDEVNVVNGSHVLGTVAVSGGQAVITTTSLQPARLHTVTARFDGTDTYLASTSTALIQQVARAIPSVAVTSSASSSVFGQPVTFTATVTAPYSTVSEGAVQFDTVLNGNLTLLGTAAVTNGTATLTTSTLPVGTHSVLALYPETANYLGDISDSNASLTVLQAPVGLALGTSVNPAVVGQVVTLTATVSSPFGTVGEGSVEFFDGVTSLGSVAVVDGVASLATSALTAGVHPVTAQYSGTGNYMASSSPVLSQFVQAPTVTALSSSQSPSAVGQEVTFTAIVDASGSRAAAGSVDFFDGAVLLGTGAVVDGVASWSTSALTVGTHSMSAQYSGTDSLAASTSDPIEHGVVISVSMVCPCSVAEGGGLTLDATGSTPGATIGWDVNGDGDFTDASGVVASLSWAQLQGLGIQDGPATLTVRVEVTLGADSTIGESVVTIANRAPAAVVTGASAGTVGVPVTLKVSAEDGSAADMAALFDYTVDWGDGTPVQTVRGPADPPVTHTYQTAGTFTVVFTATDRDGGTSAPTAVTMVIAAPPPAAPTPPASTPTLAATGASGGAETALLAVWLIAAGSTLIAYRRRTA